MNDTPQSDFQPSFYDKDELKQMAAGRWNEILAAAGIPQEYLTESGHPCPKCGGHDRFATFKDTAETGGVICRKCFNAKNQDGLATLQWILDCDFKETLQWLGEFLNANLSTPSTSTVFDKPLAKTQNRRRRQSESQPKRKTFPTAEDAMLALDEMMTKLGGHRIASWYYLDESGNSVGVIVRYDTPTPPGEKQCKEFRPLPRIDDGWVIGGMPEPRPLYCLPELINADRVYICEGEKAADAARQLGLIATTSAHGSPSPSKSDWTVMANKECVVVPDNDEAGETFANTVIEILRQLSPAPRIKILCLPDLPASGDFADWVRGRSDVGNDDLRQQIGALISDADVLGRDDKTICLDQFEPFPIDVLPEPACEFVKTAADSIGCDPSYVAVPLLCGLAGVVGATRQVLIRPGWKEPCVLWAAVIGESGSQKSPAQEIALAPLQKLQAYQIEQLPELQRQYERNKSLYESDKKDWHSNGRKNGEPPPEPPDEPKVPRYIVSDQTIEALADRLDENRRGLLSENDELTSWFGGMNRYRSGPGDEVGQWLSMHRAGKLLVDRKTGSKKTIFVRYAAVSIIGGITPGGFRKALTGENMENGLAARLLVVIPPRRPKRWRNAQVEDECLNRIERLYGRLLALDFTVDDNDSQIPVSIPLSEDAVEVFSQFVNEHGDDQLNHTGLLSSVWSKLEAGAARFALLFSLIRWANGEISADVQQPVSVGDVVAGIKLARWFGNEWRRLVGMFYESNEHREQRELLEWINRKGGRVTTRQIQQGHRKFTTSAEAEEALEELVEADLGKWESSPSGSRGQPTRYYVSSTVYGNTPNIDEKPNTVDVDSVDDTQIHSEDDEWGEL